MGIELLFLIWFIILIGFYKKDYTILTVASMVLIIFGIEIFRLGLPNSTTYLNYAFAVLSIYLGFYIMFRSIIAWLEKDYEQTGGETIWHFLRKKMKKE
jgi:uncharacterized membrane protein YfcA